MFSLRVSWSVMSIASMRSCTASLRPIELVIPSLHESVPGHDTTSLISREPASPRPSSDSARQTSYTHSSRTQRSTKFCCTVVRA